MAKQLTIQSIGAEKGKVVVGLASPSGREFELKLSAFDVPVFVGELDEARGVALGQASEPGSAKALRIQGLGFGEDETYAVLRIQVNDLTRQDFAIEKGSPVARVLQRLAAELAREQEDEGATRS